jgi:hypothetical protein
LPPEYGFFRIQTKGKVIKGNIQSVLLKLFGGRGAGERMIISDEIKAFMLGLKGQMLPHRTEIIAYMELS